jgi:uncharacterized protein (UPF0332 family)
MGNNQIKSDKKFRKACKEKILEIILDYDMESLKDMIEYIHLSQYKFSFEYSGTFKKIIKIKKKNFDKCKNYKSLYFDIRLVKKDDEDLDNSDYECTIKFFKNNIIQTVVILSILKKFVDKNFDISNAMSLVSFIRNTEVTEEENNFSFQDAKGNSLAHIIALYDQVGVAKYYNFDKNQLSILNGENLTPFLLSSSVKRRSLTSKYFNMLLNVENATKM